VGEQSFRLPDVGEGLTEAEVLRWLVRPGDHVEVNQMVVEIETAKAAVELPCPFAGTVVALLIEAGSIVPVGTPIITVLTDDAAPAPERQSVLVGYGVRAESAPTRRRRRASPAGPEPTPSTEPVPEESAAPPTATERPRAKPPVRRLARELGVDLRTVPPSGAHGEVTRADVLGTATPAREGRAPQPAPAAGSSPRPGERIPVRGVHRSMAEAMVASAFTAPHVTEWVEVDMSRALQVLARLRELPDAAEVRLTPMALVAVGLVRAAVRHPLANSTWVEQADGPHVHLHADVNLGIAVDTPRGLVVPVVRGASGLGVLALAARMQVLIEAARGGRATPADLTGGTISLTNIGVFGIDGGTPILSPGQTAILAMGRILDRPWVVDGSVVPRPVMQLSLSFDHRVIDGAVGSRVLRDVADFLDDPALALALDRELG
jgi:2-oxoisovalerate dehydrogenase E2 component (dihydrolipoyl transacylase)